MKEQFIFFLATLLTFAKRTRKVFLNFKHCNNIFNLDLRPSKISFTPILLGRIFTEQFLFIINLK